MKFYEQKHILVTGGAGAIGWNLVKALSQIPGCTITVLDDFSSGTERVDKSQVAYIEGSIVDEEKLAAAFAPKPSIVFHLASHFANQNSVEHPEKDLDVNGLGTLKLLQHAAQQKVERFIFTSSSCVYGSLRETGEEQGLTDFHTPYAIHKFLGELYCQYFYRLFHLPVVILRYFNCYGPGEPPGRYRNVIPNFIAAALRREPLSITGTGEETRDFNYVEDVVKKTLFVAAHPKAVGEVFNIGSGKETSIRALAERINTLVGNPAGIQAAEKRSWDKLDRRRADITKFSSLSYGGEETPLEEGLRRTIAYIKQRGYHKRPVP